MIKFRMEIVALPDTREEALALFDGLSPLNEDLKMSVAQLHGEELWRIAIETELGEDDRTIDQLQDFLDAVKKANATVAVAETATVTTN